MLIQPSEVLEARTIEKRLCLMSRGIWTHDELKLEQPIEFLEQLDPSLVSRRFVTLGLRVERFHDAADSELIQIENRLAYGWQIEAARVTAGLALSNERSLLHP